MDLQALGYVGVRAKNLDDWVSYGTRLLGMQMVDRAASKMALRMDDRKQRVIVNGNGGEGIDFIGLEATDALALDELGARLEAHGIEVTRATRALADERFVKDLIVFSDPAGNRIEVFHGAEVAAEPFVPGRAISGFRTGPLGMGHVVLTATNVEELAAFYRDVLGFRLSDYFVKPVAVHFFHLNARHHTLGILEFEQERYSPHDGRGEFSRRRWTGL